MVVGPEMLHTALEGLELLLALAVDGLVVFQSQPPLLHLLPPFLPVPNLRLLLRKVQSQGIQLALLALQPLLQVSYLNLLAIDLLHQSVRLPCIPPHRTLPLIFPAMLAHLLLQCLHLRLVVLRNRNPTLLSLLVKLPYLLLVVLASLSPVLAVLGVELPL